MGGRLLVSQLGMIVQKSGAVGGARELAGAALHERARGHESNDAGGDTDLGGDRLADRPLDGGAIGEPLLGVRLGQHDEILSSPLGVQRAESDGSPVMNLGMRARDRL